MSVREEDRQKNCPSRGLGIAAAAIGVGVGAALYYFFNKRSENPDASGSTSNWTYEEPHALRDSFNEDSDASVSETSTNSDDTDDNSDDEYDTTNDADTDQSHVSISDTSEDTSMHMFSELNTSDATTDNNSYITISEYTTTDTSIIDISDISADTLDTNNISLISIWDERDVNLSDDLGAEMSEEWESVLSAMSIPSYRDPSRYHVLTDPLARARLSVPRRDRERSWTLEECSICFESMQRDQEVMALSCTHRFHQPCILPWLQERQTCPNCRKDA